MDLSSAAASLTLTSGSQWSLAKTGSLSGNTVTWNVTATKSATVSNQLVLSGHVRIKNNGSGPATIGNIVVNLQKRQNNKWVSASADVADATSGDAATTAKIHAQASSENRTSFTENTASGTLKFMDAVNNSVFSLVPQMMIGAGQSKNLLFQATFSNDVLQFPKNTSLRSEVIVSFGNATVNGNSTPNLDINGNGSIDADEHHVRSVPSRLGLTVPKSTPTSSTATLTDTLADIAATGTVTFSSVWFNLGPTGGTVTAVVDGGTDGGTITNCAHLTSQSTTTSCGGYNYTQSGGQNLQACSTIDVGGNPTTCIDGTPGCGWKQDDERSYAQLNWDSSGAGAPLITQNFATVYAGIFDVGIVGPTTYSMTFTSASTLLTYLPAAGPDGALTSDLLNPTTSSAGEFGGDVVALKLNIDFSDRGILPHSSPTAVGDLLLCNVTPSGLNGSNVRALLDAANALLAGSSSPYSIADIAALVRDVNAAFVTGSPSTFAQDHLFVGACPL